MTKRLAVVLCMALCFLLMPMSAHARQRTEAYYDTLDELGLTLITPSPSPTPHPTPRVRSEEYYEAMERISFSAITSGLIQGEELLRVHPSKPMVALTFDDGPSSLTPRILSLLNTYGGRATFFMVGNRINNHRDIVAQVAQQGSEIGTHTWSHPDLTKLSSDDIYSQLTGSMEAISAITGQPVTLMRPPYGNNNETVRNICARLGMPLIRWSIDTEDWKTRDAGATYGAIFDNLKPNSIILCHDIHEPTIEAMEYVIPELINRGYQLVTISELFEHTNTQPVPGRVYHSIGQ